ncbi:LytR/AlgR family response regulator transcription factor [Bizionia sediminis]|uniref:LytR/AlgR family response regulator transcription factor n=1 Tax=Bizionia sediminis TaxID=1737064 RepID=A0ABW5KU80_9FLAO
MNYIIIDDEATARTIIKGLSNAHDSLKFEAEFSNPIEALKYLNSHQVDVIFLDIHMPGFSGFDFIQTLKFQPKIILTTSDANFAIKAFEYPLVIDYLVKPIQAERFNKMVKKLETQITQAPKTEGNDDYLFVSVKKRLVKIQLQDLCYLESNGDYVNFVTETDSYPVHTTLKSIASKLPDDVFCKAHRSYVVNILKIEQIQDNTIRVGNAHIPLGKTNKADFLKRLNFL